MSEQNNKIGLIIFGAIIFAVLIASLAAYMASGDLGIEERFSDAVGLSGGEHDHDHEEAHDHEEGSGFFGFIIEGNILSYAVILIILIAASMLLYWKFRG